MNLVDEAYRRSPFLGGRGGEREGPDNQYLKKPEKGYTAAGGGHLNDSKVDALDNSASKDQRLEELEREYFEAQWLAVEDVAAQVKSVGFQCLRCGRCCTGDDAHVFLFPGEVRHIASCTGESWLEVTMPPATGEWDDRGNYHTLEWHLRRVDGDCKYYCGSGCAIYGARPAICRTYPFFLDGDGLKLSECDGLGRPVSEEEARGIAVALIERYKRELVEAIGLISRYSDFCRGRPSDRGSCVVHDSEGEHWISWREIPDISIDHLRIP